MYLPGWMDWGLLRSQCGRVLERAVQEQRRVPRWCEQLFVRVRIGLVWLDLRGGGGSVRAVGAVLEWSGVLEWSRILLMFVSLRILWTSVRALTGADVLLDAAMPAWQHV